MFAFGGSMPFGEDGELLDPRDPDDRRKIQDIIQAQAAREAMKVADRIARRRQFLDSLTVEQAIEFRYMLHRIMASSSPRRTATYELGIVTSLIEVKYQVCIVCGKDHTAESIEELCEGGHE